MPIPSSLFALDYRVALKKGERTFGRGRFILAERAFQRALDAARRLGARGPGEGPALSRLATSYAAEGFFERAELCYRRSIAALDAGTRTPLSEEIRARLGLATLLGAEHRHAEAERLYRQVVALLMRAGPPRSRDTAFTLHRLALSCGAQAREREARVLLERALRVDPAVLRAPLVRWAAPLDPALHRQCAQGAENEAERLFLSSLELDESGRLGRVVSEHLARRMGSRWGGERDRLESLVVSWLGPEHGRATEALAACAAATVAVLPADGDEATEPAAAPAIA